MPSQKSDQQADDQSSDRKSAAGDKAGSARHSPAVFTDTYQPPAIAGDFRGKHIVTVEQFAKPDLEALFRAAATLKKRLRSQDRGVVEIASGYVLALLFFESSTRTDMSFQAAMLRLGGKVISVSNGIEFSSVYKGENLPDTVRAAGCYADIIALRHPEVGASCLAAYYLDELAGKIGRRPTVISAGDGTGEHPTQALLDLFTILESKQTLDDLNITMVGDLKHGRTVHSLARLLAIYGGKRLVLSRRRPCRCRRRLSPACAPAASRSVKQLIWASFSVLRMLFIGPGCRKSVSAASPTIKKSLPISL